MFGYDAEEVDRINEALDHRARRRAQHVHVGGVTCPTCKTTPPATEPQDREDF